MFKKKKKKSRKQFSFFPVSHNASHSALALLSISIPSIFRDIYLYISTNAKQSKLTKFRRSTQLALQFTGWGCRLKRGRPVVAEGSASATKFSPPLRLVAFPASGWQYRLSSPILGWTSLKQSILNYSSLVFVLL